MAAAPRKLKLPVPVTIITGGLGTGKTTVLRHLVATKPPEEVWAIVVNEFGAVGIDGAAIEAAARLAGGGGGGGSGGGAGGGGAAVVKQIAGGCMCCVTSGVLTACIAQIVRQVKPDRLLLEPSGLGHPGGLVDVLQGEHLRSALQLNAIVCLVDLSSFDPAVLEGVGVIQDQIAIADILVGSKADLLPGFPTGSDGVCDAAAAGAAAAAASASPAAGPAAAAGGPTSACGEGEAVAGTSGIGAVGGFTQWAEALYPRKAQVLVVSSGRLDPSVLDRPRSSAYATLTAAWRQPRGGRRRGGAARAAGASAHLGVPPLAGLSEAEEQWGHQQQAAADEEQEMQQQPAPHAPVRVVRPADADGQRACGWVFHQSDTFHRPKLLSALRLLRPRVSRVKGVFRVGAKDWVIPSLALGADGAQDVALTSICFRGESSAEVILGAPTPRPVVHEVDTLERPGADAGAVAAAVAAAEAGEYGALEAMLVGALVAG